MKKINVLYCGWGERWQLGQLAHNNRHLLFEYSAEALKKGLELSPLNLKLRTEAYMSFPLSQMRLPGLISDSLPDGWGLLLMDKLFRKQHIRLADVSPLDRLSFIGHRGMGALSFEPETGTELEPQDLKILDIALEIQKFISNETTRALLQLAQLGGSPQGARPKVLVNYDTNTERISTDPHGNGDPWIIKFQAEKEHKEVCAIEELYAKLAKKSGLTMSDTRYFELGKNLSAFGTKRFDREKEIRVPIHSLAGALNADFRIPGSTSYTSFLRLTRIMTKSEQEVYKAFRQCVFNVVFNNRDDHGKNLSYRLGKDRRWKLSPAYDLTFNVGPGGEHQMDIQGEGKNPDHSHLMGLADDADLDQKEAQEVIDQVIETAEVFKTEAKNLPIRQVTVREIHSAISKNVNRVRHS